MSSSSDRMIEEMEERRDEAVAAEIGITYDDYQGAGAYLDIDKSGIPWVIFPDHADAEVLAKVEGLQGDRVPLPMGFLDDPDPVYEGGGAAYGERRFVFSQIALAVHSTPDHTGKYMGLLTLTYPTALGPMNDGQVVLLASHPHSKEHLQHLVREHMNTQTVEAYARCSKQEVIEAFESYVGLGIIEYTQFGR